MPAMASIPETASLVNHLFVIAGPIRLSNDAVMGLGIAVTCLMLMARDRWLLSNTKKGERLTTRFGPGQALWVLRGLLAAGTIFGILLAFGAIRPLKW